MSKISVIMSAYNSEKYINEAIDSILSQTFTDFELLIRDDGSVDDTLSILEGYNDNRIKILSGKNLGVSESRNECIKIAKGKYIAIMDADDISFPGRFEKQYDFMEKNLNCAVVGSYYDAVDENGKFVELNKVPYKDESPKRYGIIINNMGHSTMMIRTNILKKINGYRKEFNLAEDRDLLYRLSNYGDLNNIQESLLKYRVHSNSITNSPSKYFRTAYYHAIGSILHEKNGINNIEVNFDNWNIKDYLHLYISAVLYVLKIIYFKLRAKIRKPNA